MKTSANSIAMVRNVLFWVFLVLLGGAGLATINTFVPSKPPILTEPPSRYLIGCFIDGEIVFSGEILGDTRIKENGTITFFSLTANTTIQIINGSCITTTLKTSYHSIAHPDNTPGSSQENGMEI